MIRSAARIILIAFAFFSISNIATAVEFTIDKNTLKEIKSNERVLAYFIGPAYYLLNEMGTNVISSFNTKPPFLSDNFKSTAFFSLDRKTAEILKQEYNTQTKGNATIKQAPLSTILWQQYKTIDQPIEDKPKIPDFIIFQSFPPTILTVEILISVDNKSFYTATSGSKKYVPAFFFQSDAKKYQEKVISETGVKYDRVLLDFGTFLREFMLPQAKTSASIVLFGEDANTLIPGFEKIYH